ncbi:MAG: helix-turn-helix domain-containing protein [Boseongicola sp. SB0677_bin_26]|nr:helix-turn-helix domain-containing protein [Boseongicola sp. SB0677_bin_26]
MGTTRIRTDPEDPSTFPEGRIATSVVDATTEAEIALQEREDEAEAMQDMARYTRRIRRRLGLSQTELARRIDVPHETIRNWEQGKRCPTGAARALLRVLDKAPETALRVLT